MKKGIVLTMLLFLATITNAQTIHWLMFCDTDDYYLQHTTPNTRRLFTDHVINVVNAALKPLGVTAAPIVDVFGTEIGYESCIDEVRNLQCSSNDIIVFYYNGHGGRNINSDETNHPFPYMWLGEDDPDRTVQLEWVHSELKKKGARLVISIADCCNSYADGYEFGGMAVSKNHGTCSIPKGTVQNIQKVFMDYSGDIIATSSKPGQPSWTAQFNGINTDAYTYRFIAQFEKLICQNNSDWATLFSTVDRITDTETNGTYDSRGNSMHQVPISRVNVTQCSRNVGNSGNNTMPPLNNNSNISIAQEPQRVIDLITRVFDYATNQFVSIDSRIRGVNLLNDMFNSDAIVKIMSQDGNIVIDREPVDSFFGRIATSSILLKVVPISFSIKNGKISELKVKEYYIGL